ncbi:MAG: prolyl oligopeptidase family serine peptidase [Brevundimonas sp.]|jgi:dipeptidyl aminopeptidase/acylaminoacyl peptidase|uniref:alpha/beta hydrolase family protein n=1 Tax=Brevundimonas sp. TaxID=1871086 RepID=UPI0025BD4975|nr:prolyl oligopeptidase family serine peptidase [Brevundimonas sp.]MCH4269677.1 prolyl oligopeptidase family serine peptidase [Brevundimonas sp.]
MLLLHGDADTNVPWRQSEQMAKVLDAPGFESELIIRPGINHSLIGETLEATQEASQRALAATLAFSDAP